MKKMIISGKSLLMAALLGSCLLTACDSSTRQTADNEQQDSTTTDTITTTTQPADGTTQIKDTVSVAAPNTNQAPDSVLAAGTKVYNQYCLVCHQANGSGVPNLYPPLAKSDWVQGDKERIINVVLKGLSGEIQVNGQSYNQVMPAHNFLSDADIAATLTYVRQSFGNQADAVSAAEVKDLRERK